MSRQVWLACAAVLGSGLFFFSSVAHRAQQASQFPFQDGSLPLAQRVDDLVRRMTLEEKVSQMVDRAPAIPRLGIPEYNWWNECLHGVARAGVATVFPQAIGLAATWDAPLIHQMAGVTSTEARAKYNEAMRNNNHQRYYGLTFWSPNINIFRDPRWGRGQETYGEDPYLTSRIGMAFVTGLQGDDPHYLKVVSTVKHFAVHSGPEPERHRFNVEISDHDMRDTYLPAFEAAIREGKADSLMGAYNAVNGEACCANTFLMREMLRGEWKFPGYVVSDCGAIADIFAHHHQVGTVEEASAQAVIAGTDLSCGQEYLSLANAVHQGLISEGEIERSVRRLFEARFRLGMFDPPDQVPYSKIPFSENDSAAHRALALETARESMVLLKNDGALPLKKNLKAIAVIGPNADAPFVQLGNYNGTPSKSTTPLAGIAQKVASSTRVLHLQGCDWIKPLAGQENFQDAVAAARDADVVVLVLGLTPRLEGEEMRVNAPGFRGGDRTSIDLPAVQERMMQAVAATGKPLVVVLLNGSALAVNWAAHHANAIVEAWYPGEEGGAALADVLFGDYNPAGRLPVTFYQSTDQLPPFEDYNMTGRTYRYFYGEPLYPFGFGLSYTHFTYSNPQAGAGQVEAGKNLKASVTVRNSGKVEGDEVVELYVTLQDTSFPAPIRSLEGFERVHLKPGESKSVAFDLTPRQLSVVTPDGRRVVEPGDIKITLGGKQPRFTGEADAATTATASVQVRITGNETPVD